MNSNAVARAVSADASFAAVVTPRNLMGTHMGAGRITGAPVLSVSVILAVVARGISGTVLPQRNGRGGGVGMC